MKECKVHVIKRIISNETICSIARHYEGDNV